MTSDIGCGLGLRKEFIDEISECKEQIDWFEIVPENWIHTPRKYKKSFEKIASSFPLVAHGLSLSIGSKEALNKKFICELKNFLDDYGIKHYSEHLSFSKLGGAQSYELLPLPMTEKMATFVAKRLSAASELLQREIIMENATYYYVPYAQMHEADFINTVLNLSGSRLLLDVNNVYVNAHNHGFDAKSFIDRLDMQKVAYYHIAGHWEKSEDIFIDTHGTPVKDDVWELLNYAMSKKRAPVLLERDSNIPPLKELLPEFRRMKSIFRDHNG